MSKKGLASTLLILAIAIVIIGAGVSAAVIHSKKAPEDNENEIIVSSVSNTQEASSSEKASDTTEGKSETQSSTEKSTESNEASSTTAEDYSFITGKYWYLYDEDRQVAYAFKFDGKDDVDLAYFDESNIMGEDAKYFKGGADYEIKDGRIIVDDIPDYVGIEAFVIDAQGGKLTYNGKELEAKDKLKLDYPFKHFNG